MTPPIRARAAAVAAALTSITLLTASPAMAAPSEGEAYRTSNSLGSSYFGLSNVCASVYTHFVADDRGAYVRINTGSNASVRIYNCRTGATRTDLYGRLTWTLTAKGFSIDCQAGLPPSITCGGSSSARTERFTTGFRGSYRRVIGSGERVAFEDGSFGDTTSVRSTVHVLINGVGMSDAVEVSAR